MTAPDDIDPTALGAIGYRKPALVPLTLRNHVVGADAFDKAFREYIRAWAFKHPTPGDFFRTIENSTGEDLSWFWRSFFYTTDVLDLGIALQTLRQATHQMARDARDQDPLTHRSTLPADAFDDGGAGKPDAEAVLPAVKAKESKTIDCSCGRTAETAAAYVQPLQEQCFL